MNNNYLFKYYERESPPKTPDTLKNNKYDIPVPPPMIATQPKQICPKIFSSPPRLCNEKKRV